MITSNDFRPGVTIEIENQVWQVVEFQHGGFMVFQQCRRRQSYL